jgi:sec-independent protein translocase protein TatA
VGALQPFHLLLILVIVLIIFGAGRLTEVGGALGKGVRDFRSSVENKESPSAPLGFCPKCGARVAETGARFCNQCGGAIPV